MPTPSNDHESTFALSRRAALGLLAGSAAGLFLPGWLVLPPEAGAKEREATGPAGQRVRLAQPHPSYWEAWCDRLVAEMLAGRTVLAATMDKDAPLRRSSPLDPGRHIAGAARPHYGTDYSSRDASGRAHPALCLYAPFDAVVIACGDIHDARGEYVALRSIQRDASLGMVVTRFHMSSQFAPMAGRRENGTVEYHTGVTVQRGQAIGLVGDTGWNKQGAKVSTGIHDDVRGYKDTKAYQSKRPFDYHPVNLLAWDLSKGTDYHVLQGRYAHNVDRAFAMRFFASLPKSKAVLNTALGGASPQVLGWYREFLAQGKK